MHESCFIFHQFNGQKNTSSPFRFKQSNNCFTMWCLSVSCWWSITMEPRGCHEFYMSCHSLSFLGQQSCPHLPVLLTPTAASSICHALVFLRPLSAPVSCCVLGVTVHVYRGPLSNSMKWTISCPSLPLCLCDLCMARVKSVPKVQE